MHSYPRIKQMNCKRWHVEILMRYPVMILKLTYHIQLVQQFHRVRKLVWFSNQTFGKQVSRLYLNICTYLAWRTSLWSLWQWFHKCLTCNLLLQFVTTVSLSISEGCISAQCCKTIFNQLLNSWLILEYFYTLAV